MPPVSVVLVDDEQLVLDGLAMLLVGESDIELRGTASSGAKALDLVRDTRPDVVVMDVRMPGMDGVATTRALIGTPGSDDDRLVRVLILSSFHDDSAVVGALRSGASGFLLKSAARTDLVSAIHRIANGDVWLDPAVARQLVDEFVARPEGAVASPAVVESLSPRERDVLLLLAQGLGTAEICAALVVSEATVKTHVARILMKLGVRDRAQAVAAAYRTGLVQLPPATPPRG